MFISLWEKRYYRQNRTQALKHSPFFIIGAPRTGSTILFQALTNFYDVLYIDNCVCRWNRNPLFGFWLSERRYGHSPHDNFRSEFGNTAKWGGHAPSECGEFWYRWLPKDRHFTDDHEITEQMVKEIRQEITAVCNYFDRPIAFKNLNAGQRLRLIQRCFPEAKLIYVRRDHRFIKKSILAARERAGVKQGEWWGIKPPNFKELQSLPENEMVAAQVISIEKQIELDLSRFPVSNHQILDFDDFSPESIMALGEWLGLKLRDNGCLPQFRKDAALSD